MSLNLTATSHTLELVTMGTGAIHVVASFTDTLAGAKTAGSQTTIISSATTTTIVSAPAASTTREINNISVEAVAANTVTIQKDVSATDHKLIGPVTMAISERIEFTSSVGWRRSDATGVAGLPGIADDTFLANISGVTASPSAVALSTLAGAGLTGGANAVIDVTAGAGASLVVTANDIQRGALTGAITASQDSNTTAFGVLAAKSVLANATNASAVPAALAGTAAFQHLRVNSANTGLEWSILTTGDFPANSVPVTALATITAKSVLANATNATATPAALVGAGALTYLRVNSANTALEFGTLPATAVSATEVSIFGTPTNTGVPFMIYVSFTAGTPGTPDDVTVFSASAPFNFRILEAWLVTATAIASTTVQARTATGGLGSALTTAISSTATGKTSDNSTVTTTVASAGSVFLRRSDRGVAGEFFILAVRT